LTLTDPYGRALSPWQPGAHLDIEVGGHRRKYSLCGDPADSNPYHVAVLLDTESRGGSLYVHETLKIGDRVGVQSPKNHFRLNPVHGHHLLIAGGIGITPIVTMADHLKALGLNYELHYIGRSQDNMAFVERIAAAHGKRAQLHLTEAGQRPDLQRLLDAQPAATEVYACGPQTLLEDLETRVPAERLHLVFFSNTGLRLDPNLEQPFEVELADSGIVVGVRADETLLQALHARGIDVASDRNEGLCGSCEVRVRGGVIDHRDKVLTSAERAANDRIMACCSRSHGKKLVLAL
jgi:ferredoxin-NADP reductase